MKLECMPNFKLGDVYDLRSCLMSELLFTGGDGSVVADTICLAIFNKVRDQNHQVRLYISAASCSFHFNTEALLYFFKNFVYL
jgi:hypothetical protein